MVGAVEFLKLFGDLEGSIGGCIVDDYDFPVEITGREVSLEKRKRGFLGANYFSVKVLARSQIIIGRFLRSL